MARLSLTFDDDQMESLHQQATQNGFATPEEYAQQMLDAQLQKIAQLELEAALLARIQSSKVIPMDEDDFRRMQESVAARIRLASEASK